MLAGAAVSAPPQRVVYRTKTDPYGALTRRAIGALTVLPSSSRSPALLTTQAVASSVPVTTADVPNSAFLDSSKEPRVAAESAPQPYVWTRHWWPVFPLSYLHKDKPNHCKLLGQTYVVWYNASSGWVLQQDRCPHRLAPLSEGRVDAANSRITCSYHGWSFDAQGKCTVIPQATDAKALTTESRRSCLTTYPTLEEGGVLYAWLDVSPQGQAAMVTAPKPHVPPEVASSTFEWMQNVNPNDYSFWVEQGMDPGHANFLHHGIGSFKMENAIPVVGELVSKVTPEGGFEWQHRGYETLNRNMQARRRFIPPSTINADYVMPNGLVIHLATMMVPSAPGESRVFFKFGSSKRDPPSPEGTTDGKEEGNYASINNMPHIAPNMPASKDSSSSSSAAGSTPQPAAAVKKPEEKQKRPGLMQSLAHWVFNDSTIGDQDIVMMHQQELLMRRESLDSRSYALLTVSDEGVVAMNKWLYTVGYPFSLWGSQPRDVQEIPIQKLLSRYERHTRHCAICQKGLALVTKVCYALTGVTALLATAAMAALLIKVSVPAAAATAAAGAAAASPAAASGVSAVLGAAWQALCGWGQFLCLAVLAAMAGRATLAAWQFREERFLCGWSAWKRRGGLSLVPEK